MICPKCQNVMKTLNKNGVHIDRCDGCHGVFLDRGELEQIVGAENAYYSSSTPPPYQAPPPYPGGHAPAPHYGRGDSPRPYYGGHGDSPRPYGHGHGHRGHRRRSFLEGLFD